MNQQDEKVSYEFYVAGVQHHKLHTCIKEVQVGDVLTLVPEPSNKYDPNAVRIEFASVNQGTEIMVGYVPAKQQDLSAKVSAALMIKDLKCTVIELVPEENPWKQLKVRIEEV